MMAVLMLSQMSSRPSKKPSRKPLTAPLMAPQMPPSFQPSLSPSHALRRALNTGEVMSIRPMSSPKTLAMFSCTASTKSATLSRPSRRRMFSTHSRTLIGLMLLKMSLTMISRPAIGRARTSTLPMDFTIPPVPILLASSLGMPTINLPSVAGMARMAVPNPPRRRVTSPPTFVPLNQSKAFEKALFSFRNFSALESELSAPATLITAPAKSTRAPPPSAPRMAPQRRSACRPSPRFPYQSENLVAVSATQVPRLRMIPPRVPRSSRMSPIRSWNPSLPRRPPSAVAKSST